MTATPDIFDRIAEAMVDLKRRAIIEGRPIYAKDLAVEMRTKFPTLREKPTKPKVKGDQFGDRRQIPPTPDQVTAYSAAIGYPMNGAAWCDAYGQKGWKVGAKRMVDWQAAVRNWKTNQYGKGGGILLAGAVPAGAARDYSKL